MASGAQRREGLTFMAWQRCQESNISERGEYVARLPVVKKPSRISLNCRAVCSISNGEAMDRLTRYSWLVIPSPQCRGAMNCAHLVPHDDRAGRNELRPPGTT